MRDTITMEIYGDVEIQFEADPAPEGDEISNYWMNTITVNGKDLLDGLSDEAKDKFLENFINAMDRDYVTELMWDVYYDR
jgi:hypothetical protein